MPLSASTLASELEALEPTTNAVLAAQRTAQAYANYFSNATGVIPGGIPSAQFAMASAIGYLYDPPNGAAQIQAGITAFWSVISTSPAAFFAGATIVTPPPTLGAIAAALSSTFPVNRAAGLSLADAMQAVAAVIHPNSLGGTYTTPGPTVTPIA